ncbi:transposase [Paenibacillaceae bacterium WGS1546]|uniref:transposase n=1 Tax=Cohnella sp. WGS1546 TaxID=3366810 RepID=UPI00372D17C7
MSEQLSYEQFCDRFSDETTCAQALFSTRWPQGFACPRCSHKLYYTIRSRRLPLYECRSCGAQTSLIAGTIMEGSRIPLTRWFQALYLHAAPQGISAARLASTIGVTYKTAWLVCHKLRHAMACSASKELLSGLVRVNCGTYGRPYNPTIYRHPQEQPLLLGATVTEDDRIVHLKIKKVQDEFLVYDRITPMGGRRFIEQCVDSASSDITIVLQKFSSKRYRPLIGLCQSAANWINHTFNGIGEKHLQSYLDQFCFNYNARSRASDAFSELLLSSAGNRTLPYPDLVRREDRSAIHKREYAMSLRDAS